MRKFYCFFLLALLPQFLFAYTLQRVSVHDPSVVWEPTSQTYYVFGSHQAWAKSTDLMNWATVPVAWKKADGTAATYANAFNTNATTTVKIGGATVNFGNFDAAAWCSALAKNHKNEPWGTLEGNLWAPDVIYNRAMNKWCMYLSLNGVEFNSVIILLTADKIEGPYVYQGPVVFGGFNMTYAETATDYKKSDLELVIGEQASLPERYAKGLNWGSFWPNCIDPCVFYDEEGNLWMTYGSWFGGIWMLQLDEETGLRDYNVSDAYGSDFSRGVNVSKDPYFGIKIAGGRGVSGEASYVKYIDGYYYLFVTYGGLNANGGYQMRVFRSDSPTGPYKDSYSDLGPSYPSHAIYTGSGDSPNYGPDATRQTSRGENIFGAYGDWGFMATGDDSERSQGHNSVITNGDQTFMVYHTRFQNRGEGHELRVHQVFKNSDGWLCAAPFEYTGETVTNTQIKTTQQISTADIPGNYKVMLHTLNLDHANKQLTTPVDIELKSDGSITGDMTGSWSITAGTSYISITVGGKTYKGVMIEQTMEPTTQTVAAFTAMTTSDGNTLWGYKTLSTIGAIDKGWADAGSYTPAYTIPSNKTLTLTFQLTNYSGDWGGYILSLAKNTVSVPQFGGDNGYVWFRSPDFAWYKTAWNAGAVVSNTNTKGTMSQSDWQAFVKGATTVMAIQRYGTQVFIKTTVTKGDDSYTHYFVTEIGTTKDVKAFLCADAATITISDFAITDTENVDPETATIGAVENTGAFGASPVTTLEPESVLTMHFTNHSAKADSYDNYGIELVYNNGSNNYADIVLGGGRWGTLLDDPVTKEEEPLNPFSNEDFLNKMDGADVTLTIARSGRVVTITAVHVPADNSTPFTLKYTLEPNATTFPDFATGNISVNLTTDHSHITYKFIAKINTTISEYGWSTFCSSYPLDFTNVDGLTAYAVTGHDGSNINKVEVASAVPAGTPLLLQGDANTTYFIPVVASGTAPAVNLLKAGTGASVAPESGKTKYALSVESGAAHFKKITSARAIPVGKAYLEFSEEIAARELGFDGFDGGDATGINMVNGEGLKVNGSGVYDLSGRFIGQWSMVNGQLKPGLYIVNGKKVVIK
jgi:arabinan endo-1,5-alpha-L-arabinosidase